MLKNWGDDNDKNNNDTADCKDWMLGMILMGFAIIAFIVIKILEFVS